MEENLKTQLEAVDLSDEYAVNLSDFALFLSVMKHKEAYQCTLSIALDERDLVLEEVKVEQVILNKSGKRAIRLDAWALDSKKRQINTEMQNDTDGDDCLLRLLFLLPRRIFLGWIWHSIPLRSSVRKWPGFIWRMERRRFS